MNARTLATALLLAALLFAAPAAAEEPLDTVYENVPCPIVFVGTYDPYVAIQWHCIPPLPFP